MKVSITTISGLAGAVALAIRDVDNLPAWAHTLCEVVSVGSLAVLGYHAQDRSLKCPAGLSRTLMVFAVASSLALSGCKVGGLGITLASPPFGSLGVALDGGLIGHGKLPLNLPPVATVRTNGL